MLVRNKTQTPKYNPNSKRRHMHTRMIYECSHIFSFLRVYANPLHLPRAFVSLWSVPLTTHLFTMSEPPNTAATHKIHTDTSTALSVSLASALYRTRMYAELSNTDWSTRGGLSPLRRQQRRQRQAKTHTHRKHARNMR